MLGLDVVSLDCRPDRRLGVCGLDLAQVDRLLATRLICHSATVRCFGFGGLRGTTQLLLTRSRLESGGVWPGVKAGGCGPSGCSACGGGLACALFRTGGYPDIEARSGAWASSAADFLVAVEGGEHDLGFGGGYRIAGSPDYGWGVVLWVRAFGRPDVEVPASVVCEDEDAATAA